MKEVAAQQAIQKPIAPAVGALLPVTGTASVLLLAELAPGVWSGDAAAYA